MSSQVPEQHQATPLASMQQASIIHPPAPPNVGVTAPLQPATTTGAAGVAAAATNTDTTPTTPPSTQTPAISSTPLLTAAPSRTDSTSDEAMVASLEEVEQKKSAASATKTKGKGTDTAAKKSQDLEKQKQHFLRTDRKTVLATLNVDSSPDEEDEENDPTFVSTPKKEKSRPSSPAKKALSPEKIAEKKAKEAEREKRHQKERESLERRRRERAAAAHSPVTPKVSQFTPLEPTPSPEPTPTPPEDHPMADVEVQVEGQVASLPLPSGEVAQSTEVAAEPSMSDTAEQSKPAVAEESKPAVVEESKPEAAEQSKSEAAEQSNSEAAEKSEEGASVYKVATNVEHTLDPKEHRVILAQFNSPGHFIAAANDPPLALTYETTNAAAAGMSQLDYVRYGSSLMVRIDDKAFDATGPARMIQDKTGDNFFPIFKNSRISLISVVAPLDVYEDNTIQPGFKPNPKDHHMIDYPFFKFPVPPDNSCIPHSIILSNEPDLFAQQLESESDAGIAYNEHRSNLIEYTKPWRMDLANELERLSIQAVLLGEEDREKQARVLTALGSELVVDHKKVTELFLQKAGEIGSILAITDDVCRIAAVLQNRVIVETRYTETSLSNTFFTYGDASRFGGLVCSDKQLQQYPEGEPKNRIPPLCRLEDADSNTPHKLSMCQQHHRFSDPKLIGVTHWEPLVAHVTDNWLEHTFVNSFCTLQPVARFHLIVSPDNDVWLTPYLQTNVYDSPIEGGSSQVIPSYIHIRPDMVFTCHNENDHQKTISKYAVATWIRKSHQLKKHLDTSEIDANREGDDEEIVSQRAAAIKAIQQAAAFKEHCKEFPSSLVGMVSYIELPSDVDSNSLRSIKQYLNGLTDATMPAIRCASFNSIDSTRHPIHDDGSGGEAKVEIPTHGADGVTFGTVSTRLPHRPVYPEILQRRIFESILSRTVHLHAAVHSPTFDVRDQYHKFLGHFSPAHRNRFDSDQMVNLLAIYGSSSQFAPWAKLKERHYYAISDEVKSGIDSKDVHDLTVDDDDSKEPMVGLSKHKKFNSSKVPGIKPWSPSKQLKGEESKEYGHRLRLELNKWLDDALCDTGLDKADPPVAYNPTEQYKRLRNHYDGYLDPLGVFHSAYLDAKIAAKDSSNISSVYVPLTAHLLVHDPQVILLSFLVEDPKPYLSASKQKWRHEFPFNLLPFPSPLKQLFPSGIQFTPEPTTSKRGARAKTTPSSSQPTATPTSTKRKASKEHVSASATKKAKGSAKKSAAPTRKSKKVTDEDGDETMEEEAEVEQEDEEEQTSEHEEEEEARQPKPKSKSAAKSKVTSPVRLSSRRSSPARAQSDDSGLMKEKAKVVKGAQLVQTLNREVEAAQQEAKTIRESLAKEKAEKLKVETELRNKSKEAKEQAKESAKAAAAAQKQLEAMRKEFDNLKSAAKTAAAKAAAKTETAIRALVTTPSPSPSPPPAAIDSTPMDIDSKPHVDSTPHVLRASAPAAAATSSSTLPPPAANFESTPLFQLSGVTSSHMQLFHLQQQQSRLLQQQQAIEANVAREKARADVQAAKAKLDAEENGARQKLHAQQQQQHDFTHALLFSMMHQGK